MDLVEYFRFALALIFVLGLIGVCTWAAKRLGVVAGSSAKASDRRLGVVEVRGIDAKHKLVLVSRDGVEHLLLLGGQQDLLIENNIQPPANTVFPANETGAPSRVISFGNGNNS